MKGLFVKLFVIGGLSVCSMNAAMATERTVVPGRTWWYTSIGAGSDGEWYSAVYGLRLGDASECETDGWLPCYAVDRHGEKLFESSLGKVRDEGSQVWLVPNLNLEAEVPAASFEEEGSSLVRLFLGYWYGTDLRPHHYDGLHWTDAPAGSPYLLYDYGYTSGDKYGWPWSGVDLTGDGWWLDTSLQRGFFVSEISEEICPDGTVRKTYGLRQLRHGETLEEVQAAEPCRAKIVEGIGIVGSYLDSYLVDTDLCAGLWIAPASPGSAQVSGLVVPPPPPCPKCVREADGTCVYGDVEFDPETYDDRPWEGDSVEETESVGTEGIPVYDLQGRRVRDPERGMYVRGGKKVIVRR